MDIRKKIIVAAVLALSLSAGAQNVSDLIVSEVMPVPDSTSLIDGYGAKTGWIELFNASQGTVNFGGCFLTDDRSDLQKSPISTLDRSTRLGPRQSVVFYTGGHNDNGTYYTSFIVRPGSTVYLVSNDGRTIVDSLQVPSDIPVSMSAAKFAHDNKARIFDEIRVSSPTPGSYSAGGSRETGAHRMGREDPHGWILTMVAVSVVFLALMLLWWLFSMLFRKKDKTPKPSRAKGLTPEVAAAISMALEAEFGSEPVAAISMALHEFLNDTVHDNESFIITINPSATSQWAQKSLGFRRSPR